MSINRRDEQRAQAEEILGDRLDQASFAKGLFGGRYLNEQLAAYPLEVGESVQHLTRELRQYCVDEIDPAAIDREAEIPLSIVRGLGRLGVLGACLPKSAGGMELGQTDYCRLLEVLGGHCGGTALFVNAHHSIGPRALVLFGTDEQRQRYLPKLVSGDWISAFALTEPEAGSDAANVQSMATPTEDGKGFLINGEKRWITNGSIAQVLTVMARTPDNSKPQDGTRQASRITAFIVTPDMPGFEVVEARMSKCGVRGTATSRLAFKDMFVPRDHVLGELGGGLKVALTVLDFGRTTFGASCTGAAKFCVDHAVRHAQRRVQFDQPLCEFELVQQKLAYMQAGMFAMESCTFQTAAQIDAGTSDFMLETAMLKVFSTDVLWQIINDTIQIYGGKAYFTDEPFERMMRDARINMIGEGANDVLCVFSALMGMRDVGLELEAILQAIQLPLGNLRRLGRFAGHKLSSLLVPPQIEVRNALLEPEATRIGRLVAKFGAKVEWLLRTYREEIVEHQHQLARVAHAVMEIYVSACVLNRLDTTLLHADADDPSVQFDLQTGRYYLQTAERRIHEYLRALRHNDDDATTQFVNALLAQRRS
jgi:alkylation response protein AidB-like acyl-CoA dehydrogenase